MMRWSGSRCTTRTLAFVLAAGWGIEAAAQTGYKIHSDAEQTMPITSQKSSTQMITLDVSNQPLTEVLRRLATQAKLKLFYDASNPVFQKRITLKLSTANVDLAFKKALDGSGLVATLASDGETCVIRPQETLTSTGAASQGAETGTITGRVSDSITGEGLVGVTVIVEGKKLSTITDSKGNFSIRDVPVGTQQLSIRLVGYKVRRSSVEVNANKTARVVIVLTTSSAMLSEIVTTASGRQRRMEVGNDIAVINVDSVMRTAPINTVTDLLEHRVPGVTVQRTGGGPGDPAIIRIRGEGSITRSNEPIVIVDGIRINSDEATNKTMVDGVKGSLLADVKPAASQLDQIDPNSIATIEVLKGPSASALYGADAANGVIVISTKRGTPGKTHWTFNTWRGIKQLPGRYPINYGYFGSGIGGYTEGDNVSCAYPCKRVVDRVISFQALNEPRYTVLDRGHDSHVSLTVGGGVHVFNYSVTGSLNNSTGYLRLPQVEIERFEASHEQAVPTWAKSPEGYATGSISSSLSFQPNDRVSARISQSLSRSLKQNSSLDGAFEALQYGALDTNRLGVNGIFNNVSPFHRSRSRNLSSKTAITSNFQVKSWLPLTATAGIDLVNRNDEQVLPRGFDPSIPLGGFRGGSMTTLTQTLNLGLGGTGVTIPIAGTRLLSITSGVNLNRWSMLSQRGAADSMPLGMELSPTFDAGSQLRTSNVTAGWFIEPKLNIQSRFFVVPGLRFDGSNTSGSRAGLASFPRLSFSWIASDEPFWPRGTGIDNLRLRTALGYGGRLPDAGSHLRLLAYENFNDGNISQVVLGLRSLGNTKLVPERNKEIEVGLDAELWGNRAHVSITYSHGITDDAIVPMPVAPSVFGNNASIPVNIGRTRKQSLEAELMVRPIENRNMSLAVTTAFSRQSNILDRLDREAPYIPGKNYIRYVEGYPLAGIWYNPVILYADLNGNGVLDDTGEIRRSDSFVFAGSATPRYMLTMFPALTMFRGRITVNATMSYRDGEVRSLQNKNIRGCIYCSADHPDKVDLAQQAKLIGVDFFPQLVNVLEFQSISVGVNLPASLTHRLKVKQSMISLQGRNLGTRTNYLRKDVGVGATKHGVIEGVPRAREWRLNMTVGL